MANASIFAAFERMWQQVVTALSKKQNSFSSGATILSSYQYGDELPETGSEGQIFFKKVEDTGEWENPPMVLGVEYLTKEKWQNKPVYTKLVDFGALPNATRKSVAHNTGATRILRLAGSASGGTMLPTYYDTNDRIEIYANKTNIYITTVTDASAQTAAVQLWYIKD